MKEALTVFHEGPAEGLQSALGALDDAVALCERLQPTPEDLMVDITLIKKLQDNLSSEPSAIAGSNP